MGQITKVTPDMIQVANNVTSKTVGNTTSGISLTFDSNGVITSAANVTLSVANTQLTGTITATQLAANSVNSTIIAANTISNTNIQTGAIEDYSRATGILSGMRNRIINGAMIIDQRSNGSSFATDSGAEKYTLDRWQAYYAAQNKYTVQQNAGSVTPPAGFRNYLGVTSSSAYTVGASEEFSINQYVEGFNWADLNWGSANAKTVTLSFWVRSSLTGTFGGAFRNYAGNRSYTYSYTINSANTWEYKTITIPGDTGGTWAGATNSGAVIIGLALGVGSSNSTAPGSWTAGNFQSVPGATSVVGTNGATFYVTGWQVEVGSTATSFDYRPYGTELGLCQRYYEVVVAANQIYAPIGTGFYIGSADVRTVISFKQTKRANPTLVTTSGADYYACYRDGAADLFNSFTINDPSTYCTQLYNNSQASGGGGQAGLLYANSNSAYLAFSAEL